MTDLLTSQTDDYNVPIATTPAFEVQISICLHSIVIKSESLFCSPKRRQWCNYRFIRWEKNVVKNSIQKKWHCGALKAEEFTSNYFEYSIIGRFVTVRAVSGFHICKERVFSEYIMAGWLVVLMPGCVSQWVGGVYARKGWQFVVWSWWWVGWCVIWLVDCLFVCWWSG